MTLRFVKTAILSSSDGIDFANEVAVESEEVTKARVAAEAASHKPLYQQLADLREQKKLEWDENTKKIFAPPKALDEDEIEFFQELESSKAKVEDEVKRRVDAELEAFRESRRLEILKEPNEQLAAPSIKLPPRKIDTGISVGVKIKAKRKVGNVEGDNAESSGQKKQHISNGDSAKSAQTAGHSAGSEDGEKRASSSSNALEVPPPRVVVDAAPTAQTGASLFGEYDSD